MYTRVQGRTGKLAAITIEIHLTDREIVFNLCTAFICLFNGDIRAWRKDQQAFQDSAEEDTANEE